jgi:hypothetical protein
MLQLCNTKPQHLRRISWCIYRIQAEYPSQLCRRITNENLILLIMKIPVSGGCVFESRLGRCNQLGIIWYRVHTQHARAERPVFELQWGQDFIFPKTSRPALDHTQPPAQLGPMSFLVVKRLKRVSNYPLHVAPCSYMSNPSVPLMVY